VHFLTLHTLTKKTNYGKIQYNTKHTMCQVPTATYFINMMPTSGS